MTIKTKMLKKLQYEAAFMDTGPEVIKQFLKMLISIIISRNSAFLGSDKPRMLF